MDIGGILRKAREFKNLTLADVEETTKIRSKYLGAMERNNFTQLPPGIYGSAFVRTYARFLGLDTDELAALYREVTGISLREIGEDARLTKVHPARRISIVRVSQLILVILVVLMIFAAVRILVYRSP